jgi:hypothetical protein
MWLAGSVLESAGPLASFAGVAPAHAQGHPWPLRRASRHDPVRPGITSIGKRPIFSPVTPKNLSALIAVTKVLAEIEELIRRYDSEDPPVNP